eukprot:TRINITY_DN12853_c0_g1_i1.p1 TRINITY_DN12853_c0_g1~~TRINITY_DN12853_c0_g1_i1.p1  ORF type:complete len:298 (-),score=95.09 TRINITY_DN12853_c0_g1_i1:155-1048(-)
MAAPPAKQAKVAEGTGIVIMMNGLPGAMGHEVGQACLRAGFALSSKALTGKGMPGEVEVVEGDIKSKITLVGPEPAGAQKACLDEAKKTYGDKLVIIDFTHPTAVNSNADLYNASGIPFVMGTTGGDRDALLKTTQDSGTYAVIASNMSKQIVALQATMTRMAADFPGAFSGYSLEVTESHQKTKADTSGTAKDMVKSFVALGMPYDVEDIKMVRTEDKQMEFGVPEEYLKGHAYHTYSLKSNDGTVMFQFQHNVNGRRTYGEGSVDAVLFLHKMVTTKSEKKLFNMIDVLAHGAMR